MALNTYTRLSDGAQITVNDTYLTASIAKKLSDPKKPEIPLAIKNKKAKNEGN
jgi:hypothetical protein